jgi:hypothetical protein
MAESDPFFPASVTPGRTDVGSELTNDLRFPHQPPAASSSTYNTLNIASQSGRMVAEPPSTTGTMFSDGSYPLGLERHSPKRMVFYPGNVSEGDLDRQNIPPWPNELVGLANPEGVALQSSFGATIRCRVFADPVDGYKLDLDSIDRARAPDFLDNRLELPAISEQHHWGYCTDSQSIFNIYEQSTQDSIRQDDLGMFGKIESTVNQYQLLTHPVGPFEQVVVGPNRSDSVLGRMKDAEPTLANARATKPFICRETGCKSEGFTHSFDLQRHRRTVHMAQGARYRCTVQGCPKADKLWTRHDGYKKHVIKRHSDANLNDLVKRFNRSRPDADARFPFSITTPTMISRTEQKAKSTKLQSTQVEDWEPLS